MTTIGSFCKCVFPDNVFCESSLPRSPDEKQLRAKRTFQEMMSYIPGMQPAATPPPRLVSTFHELRSTCQHTLTCEFIDIYLSDFLGKCMGEEAKYEGTCLLFDGLQQPVLNKQVGNARERTVQTNLWYLLEPVHL